MERPPGGTATAGSALSGGVWFGRAEEDVRRLVGMFVAAALATALIPRIASAASLPAESGRAIVDLPAQLMQTVFGESSDANASFAAAYGDRISESPLRDLALRTAPVAASGSFVEQAAPTFAFGAGAHAVSAGGQTFDLAQAMNAALLHASPHFTIAQQNDDAAAAPADAPAATFAAGDYQPVARVTIVSPQSEAFSLGGLVRGAPPAVAAGSALAFGEGAVPGATGAAAAIPSSLRVGPLRFTTSVESASLTAPSVGMNDNAYGAGANLNVRAGARTLTLGVSSNYERLTRNDSSGMTPAAFGSSSSWQLPGSNVPLAVPNYADVSKVSVGAGVAVPVFNGLTLNLDYAADRMFGGYGLPGVTNLDAFDNSYGGKLTFEIPHSSSTVSISARQLHYLDSLIPANTSTQTREDVNFTVKF